MSAAGKFVWRTLMTQDAEAAKAFYAKVLGWTITDHTMGEMTHAVASVGDVAVADFVQADDPNIPSHWMAYAAVDDLDRANALVQELGGTVMAGPIPIPEVGRFSVIQDPQGAMFWPFEGEGDGEGPPDELGAQHGCWGWAELMTTDIEAALGFYGQVVGWETRSEDMPTGPYALFKAQGQDRAGGMNIPEGVEMPPAWISYATVDDLAAALERVKAAGGQVVMEPMEVPGIGIMAGVYDASGAYVTLAEWRM